MVTIDDIKLVKDFLGRRGIDFVLTGTAALDIHGLMPENYVADDIDIIVIASGPTQQMIHSILGDLEKLTGGQNTSKEEYEHACYAFFVGPNRVKVNAIVYQVDESLPFGHNLTKGPIPTYIELTFGKKTLKLHAIDEILKAKFGLGRPKDYKFCNELLATILTYFKK